MEPVPDDVVAAFARDGVACLRSVLDPGQVAAAADAIEAVLASPGPLAQVASVADDPGAFIDADRGAWDLRQYDLQPGDAIFFDFLTVHGAPGFGYPTRRRSLSLRYLSAGATHAPRAWRTSPPYDDLQGELPVGAPMDHPLFPVVWPAV
jgi:hypothetical protein